MAKGSIKINQEKCKGCLLCVAECKFDEIEISKKVNNFGNNIVNFKNEGRCTGCTLCAIICPDAAIEVFQLVEV